MIQPEDKLQLIKFCIDVIIKAGYEYSNYTKLVNAANDMADIIIKLSGV